MSTADRNLTPGASTDRFETLFEQAPFSLQILAPDGRTLRVNKAWEELWGATEELKSYVVGVYNVLDDPQLQSKGVAAQLRQALSGTSVEIPAIYYDPAELGRPGRARWVRAAAHPIRHADGRVREVMLMHEDVTDRVQAEEALRSSELRLKQLANTIPQLAWMADPGGSIHWYNERWYAYTGTTFAQMEGWGWQSVHDPEALPQILAQWKKSLASGEAFEMTFPLRGRDDRYRPFLTLVAPLKDEYGRVVQWFGTNTDVSALQEAERDARVAEERLRLAVRAGNIGIWDWDLAANTVAWSDEVYALHGLPLGAFGGGVEDFLTLVHPDDRAALEGKVRDAVAASGGFMAEFRIVLPNGEERWLSTWAMVRFDARGTATRMIGATLSVDEYKKSEAALREGDRLKDEFLAMLAHELRNPLAPISTSTRVLKRLPGIDADASQAIDIIGRQVSHMTELVDDLLDASRVTRGLIRVETVALGLATVIESAVEQARPLIEARGHELTWAVPSTACFVLGDRTRLIQALVNLLNNAARYTPQGGLIDVAIEVEEGLARVRVRDNGAGISADFLPHVFNLFSQSARAPDRAIGGLGIGLALVRRIVELHGGTVAARSEGAGRGSVFEICLPLVAAEPVAARRDGPPPAAPSEGLSVMLVDDNQDAAEALAALLRMQGHTVTLRHDGPGALEASCAASIDVFVLDIGLPGMNGHDLARRLRERHPEAVYIALTGYGQAEDREQSKSAGFDHHFLKPADLDALDRVLLSIGARQARRD